MSLFDNMLKDNESVFKDEDVLDFDYLPDILPYRENQQTYIADCIKPLAQGRSGKNLLISGAPGIGKTSSVKYVFRELEDTTDEIKHVFVNCWKRQTTNAVLGDLAGQMGVIGAQFKNSEDLWEHIFKAISRYKGVVIALDEIDRAKDYDFLYQIAENLKRFTLVMITNEADFLSTMDIRIKSRLAIEELIYPPYKRHEIAGILEERKNAAFCDSVWGEEAFDLVVERCVKKNDIRIGLVLMKEAGRAAERDSLKRISVEHVMGCKAGVVDGKIESDNLDARERAIYEAIKESPGVESGQLSTMVKERGYDLADSTFRRLIQKLDKGGYIFREQVVGAGGGQTMKHFVDE